LLQDNFKNERGQHDSSAGNTASILNKTGSRPADKTNAVLPLNAMGQNETLSLLQGVILTHCSDIHNWKEQSKFMTRELEESFRYKESSTADRYLPQQR